MKQQLILQCLCMAGLLLGSSSGALASEDLISVNGNYHGAIHYADVDGDGVKEGLFLGYMDSETYTNVNKIVWMKPNGETILATPLEMEIDSYAIHDLNNDDIPDIFFRKIEGGYHKPYFAFSSPTGYTIEKASFSLPRAVSINFGMLTFGDFNRDGRVDIFHYEVANANASGSSAVYTPYLYLQMQDGSFVRTPFPETTDADAIDNAMFSSGQSGAFSVYIPVNIMRPTSLIPATKANVESGWQTIDLNQDGYLDIISSSGLSYISLQDGTWYQASIAGTVGMNDFNQDGVKDLVVFDAETGQVDILTSSPNGMQQSQLYNNANIKNVFCEDLNADGLSDILLLAKVNSYMYFLFFKNNGDGTFKRTERAVAVNEEYKYFYASLEYLNSNGFPTMVTASGWRSYSGIHYDKDIQRVDWDSNFTLTESELAPAEENWRWDPTIEDYYCDGRQFISIWMNGTGETFLYPVSGATATKPSTMAAPNVIVDKTTGVVKVTWAAGNDAETSRQDLDYEVQVIASESTDVLLQTKTCGNLSLIFDPSTWEHGDYEVQVRAINKKNLAGEWSESSSFTNAALPNAGFTLSETTIYMVDTLIVTSLSGQNLNLRVLPEGQIVSNENGVARIVFNTFGNKTIQATTAAGTAFEQTLYVEPFKKVESSESRFWGIVMFDYNQDGKIECWSDPWTKQKGLYTMDKGISTPYPSLNLSDVAIDYGYNYGAKGPCIVDNNRDGLPDIIYKRIDKNGTKYTVMHNLGDLDFEFTKVSTQENGEELNLNDGYYTIADLDNDGLADIIYGKSKEYAVYKNMGSGKVKEAFAVTNIPQNIADIDNNGYLDLAYYNGTIYFNKGNLDFEEAKVIKDFQITHLRDIDHDGNLDLICSGDYYSNEAYVALGNGDGTFKGKTALPGAFANNYFDNDGRWDYIVGQNREYFVYLDRADGATLVPRDMPATYEGMFARFDIDEDGYPDEISDDGFSTTKTRITNTKPTAPTNVFVRQTASEVVVTWEGATDNETPLNSLTYNLSIREKGTNNYIISPLNRTKNEALTMYPGYTHYRKTRSYPIPFSAFTAGKTYEICVQSIDPWFYHSDFSKPIEFTPAEKVLITLPTKGGVNLPVKFEYASNSTTPTIVADGDGVVSGNTITWSTAGEKTVTAISGSTMSTQTINIVDKPNLTFSVPSAMVAETETTVTLPTDLTAQEAELQLSANSEKVKVEVANGVANVKPLQTGEYTLTLTYTDPIFGKLKHSENFTVVENIKPTLQMVTVEGENNRISWSYDKQLPTAYNGNVNIYKETNIADKYEHIATVPYNSGSYIDEAAYADVRSSRYMIALATTNGAESHLSDVHGSIHMMINQGMGHNVNLHWTPYVGAEIAQYTILSGSSADDLTVLGYISGNAQSFTHKRNNNTDTYYALAYTLKGESTTRTRTASLEGRSNVICSNAAYAVTLAESIAISCREDNMLLNDEQTQLHLSATITPINVTLNRVEWSITQGDKYASISSDGVLTLTAREKSSGIIVVQAKAIDGSDVATTANIILNYEATGISSTKEDTNAGSLKPRKVLENGKIYIVLPTEEKFSIGGIKVE